jgi:hypothetical protein
MWGDAFVLLERAHPNEKYPARKVRLDQLREAFEACGTSCVTSGEKETPPLPPGAVSTDARTDPTNRSTNPTPGESFFPRSDTSGVAGYDPGHWLAMAKKCAVNEDETRGLVEVLGLPAREVIERFPLLGYDPDHHALTFPLSNGRGAVTGLFRRPSVGRPRAYKGAKGTLFIPPDWQNPGTVIVTEGLSDTLAAVAAGLSVVGRLSAHAGAADLTELFSHLSLNAVVVFGDDDAPGREGAEMLARFLAPRLRCRVSRACPPTGFKDVREWLTAPEREETSWSDRGRELLALFGG